MPFLFIRALPSFSSVVFSRCTLVSHIEIRWFCVYVSALFLCWFRILHILHNFQSASRVDLMPSPWLNFATSHILLPHSKTYSICSICSLKVYWERKWTTTNQNSNFLLEKHFPSKFITANQLHQFHWIREFDFFSSLLLLLLLLTVQRLYSPLKLLLVKF